MFANQKGFTLVEALASVVILGIVVISFTTLSSYTGLANKKSNTASEAMLLAQSTLNELRSTDPASLQTVIQAYNDQTRYASEKYAIFISTGPLAAGTTDYSIPKPAFAREKIISATGIVSMNRTPTLLAVTVSWRREL